MGVCVCVCLFRVCVPYEEAGVIICDQGSHVLSVVVLFLLFFNPQCRLKFSYIYCMLHTLVTSTKVKTSKYV